MHEDESEIVGRARALVPMLWERGAEAERERRLTGEMIGALGQSGMFTLLKPRSHGGLEVDLRTYVAVLAELGRGSGSASWVAGQFNNAAWLAAQFPGELGEELLAPGVCLALVQHGQVSLTRAAGGYVVSGRWPYCSGCHHADWVLAVAALEDDQGKPAPGMFAIPKAALEIQDDWQVSGLCATGSHTVVARSLFVPASRRAWLGPIMRGEPPPARRDGPLYRTALVPLAGLSVAAPALGLGQAMLDEFRAQLDGRPISSTLYEKLGQAPVVHRQLGEAAMKLEVARALILGSAEEMMRVARRGERMSLEARVRAVTSIAYAVHQCQQLVDSLFSTSGARALYSTNPLQRIVRDLRALSVHPLFALDARLELLGRNLLGLPPGVPLV